MKLTTAVVYMTQGSDPVEVDQAGATLLDGMVRAQDDLGTIHWTKLGMTIAYGVFWPTTDGLTARVVAVDADNCDVRDALEAAVWVNR